MAAGSARDTVIDAMPWIQTVRPEAASGRLAKSYRAGVERAGRVFGIVRTMSLQPAVLDASMGLYLAIMKQPGELSLAQREMLATVVSRANDCHY
ncbi:MAG: peroxidase [Acidobacteria bacterium]|nr:peroxidase [Acidobacteriota bacterium]